MNALVLHNVPHDIPFHPFFMTMWFLLLSMSASLFLISFMGLSGVKKFDRYVGSGYLAAMALIGIAPMFILMQLGQPLRAYQLLLNFNLTSPLSWGVITVTGYFILAAIYGWHLLYRKDYEKAKRWGVGTAIFAGGLFLYSGSVLMVVESRVLWHSSLLPVLFVASGFVSAIAALLVIEILGDVSRTLLGAYRTAKTGGSACSSKLLPRIREAFSGPTSQLGGTLVQDIAIDIMLIITFVLVLAAGSQAAHETVAMLLDGEFRGVFLGVQLLLGAFVPLALLVFLKRTKAVVLTSALLSLVGIYAMRYVFVVGGLTLPLS